MLTYLYYLYTKSSKKHRELKYSYAKLKGEFKMCTSRVTPVKATGTRWINHELQAMDGLIEKFGLYYVHLNSMILTTTNSTEKATLERKFNKPEMIKFSFVVLFYWYFSWSKEI